MKKSDIAIIGGGLAGLTAAIHLAGKDFSVAVYEKEKYPTHKVCGEYLSREILPYFKSLSIDISSLHPVDIGRLVYSTPSGNTINSSLPLGGIGVSRYSLDNHLMQKAREAGVEIYNTTVQTVEFTDGGFVVNQNLEGEIKASIVLGAFGKRSILDKKLNRSFIEQKTGWLAVKAHYQLPQYPETTVSLHNFKGGYCGLSKTETGAVNVCYLATYESFKKHKDPEKYKEEVLCKNPHLKNFFENAEPLFEKDITIAQIYFSKKSLVEKHIMMIGDAAGMIHPLCGNGMAMGIHSAKIASETILKYYSKGSCNRAAMEKDYINSWNKTFSARLKAGRILQKILLNPTIAEASHHLIKTFPPMLHYIINKTHGKPLV